MDKKPKVLRQIRDKKQAADLGVKTISNLKEYLERK